MSYGEPRTVKIDVKVERVRSRWRAVHANDPSAEDAHTSICQSSFDFRREDTPRSGDKCFQLGHRRTLLMRHFLLRERYHTEGTDSGSSAPVTDNECEHCQRIEVNCCNA